VIWIHRRNSNTEAPGESPIEIWGQKVYNWEDHPGSTEGIRSDYPGIAKGKRSPRQEEKGGGISTSTRKVARNGRVNGETEEMAWERFLG